MAGTDLGAVRTLVVAARLEDAGVTSGLAKIEARSAAADAAMGRAAASVSELRNQLFFLAFTGGAATAALISQQAKLEKQITLASLAMDGTTDNMEQLEEQTFRLADRFNELPTQTATAVREIQQLGVQSDEAREQLTRASLALSKFTGGELAEETAARGLFRLIRLTSRSQEEVESASAAARAYASSIAAAGDATAAGIGETVQAIEKFSALGTAANFTREEIIALSSAFTDVEQGRFQRISSSIIRMFGREFIEKGTIRDVARLMGLTVEEARNLRDTQPGRFLAQFAESLRQTRGEVDSLLPLMRQMGFENIRDERTLLQLVAGIEKFRDILPQAQKEVQRFQSGQIESTEFMRRLNAMTSTTTSQFEGLLGTLQQTATQMGDMLVKFVLPLAGGLEGLAQILNENPVLTGLLVAGVGTFTVGALARGTRLLAGFGAAGLPSGLFGPAVREGGALVTGARGALGTAGLEGLLFGAGSGGARAAGGRLATAFSRRLGRAQAAAIASQAAGRGGLATKGAFASGLVSQRLLGRVAQSAGAGRLVGATSAVGGLLAALSLLEPVAGAVADNIEGLVGKGTGTFSALGELLIFVLRIVELLGATINRAFEELMNLAENPIGAAILGAAIGGVVGGPMGALVGAAGAGGLALFSEDITTALRTGNEELQSATQFISGDEGGDDGPGGAAAPTTINVINEDKDQAKKTAREAVARGPRNTVPIKVNRR